MSVPTEPGIYVMIHADATPPEISELTAPAYRPYKVEELRTRWIAESEVVYIGKANGLRGLRGRLRPYARRVANHSGGRSIWQLDIDDRLIVVWIPTPGWDPGQVEKDYIEAFRKTFGQRTFANRRD